jgi:hypothetical protein
LRACDAYHPLGDARDATRFCNWRAGSHAAQVSPA